MKIFPVKQFFHKSQKKNLTEYQFNDNVSANHLKYIVIMNDWVSNLHPKTEADFDIYLSPTNSMSRT